MKNTPSQDNIKHINVYIFSGFEKKKKEQNAIVIICKRLNGTRIRKRLLKFLSVLSY